MNEKYDALVVKTTRLLKMAEISKADLRKILKSLNKQLVETRENWQGDSEAQAEEILSLRSLNTALKIKVAKQEKVPVDYEIVNQKCTKCNTVAKVSRTLTMHMKEVHGVKQKVLKCQMCPRTFTEKYRLGKHIEDHKDIQF